MCKVCLPHSVFHHLAHPDSVLIDQNLPDLPAGYFEKRPLFIHLTVTGRCYARCAGCVNAAVTLGVEGDRSQMVTFPEAVPERDAGAVLRLADLTPDREVVLCFYGGEPLLAPDKISRVMDFLDSSTLAPRLKYMLITNGELFIPTMSRYPGLLESLWLVAVSLDGRRVQHNRVRRGTDLDKIHENLAALKEVRQGEVLMWSTLREDQSLLDCFREFQVLRRQGWAEHFFWHWAEAPQPYLNLPGYLEAYEGDLRQVLSEYCFSLAQGDLLSIVHLNELILYLVTGKSRGSSACGVELATNYDLVGGKVFPCADLPPELALGDIAPDGSLSLNERDLHHLVDYKERLGCHDCGVHPYCGGRCPVQAATAGFETLGQYCALMRLHVAVVQDYLPDITNSLKKNNISLETLYTTSAYLTQFTDVTP